MDATKLYETIPNFPETASAGNVLARLVDGLGFRYRWSTEGLSDKEMDFKPTEQNMTLMKLLLHLYGMAKMTCTAFGGTINEGSAPGDFVELRHATLQLYYETSTQLRGLSDEAVQASSFPHRSSDGPLPFWYLINGPIADALTHVGQISSWRRIAGNPQPGGVSVLWGTSPESDR